MKSSTGEECPVGAVSCVDATWKIIDSGLWAVGVIAILAVIVQVSEFEFIKLKVILILTHKIFS